MTMDTLELVRRLLVAGVAVDLTDHGTIRLSGHPVPDDLLAELKANKTAILETTASPAPSRVATSSRRRAWRVAPAHGLERVRTS
jgi:hypothetical protein